ncbi:hypothetical protein THAOC_25726, partial [Thalassiosira oceanica]
MIVEVAMNVGVGNADWQISDNARHQSKDVSLGRVWIACSFDDTRVVCDSFRDGSGLRGERFPRRDDSENDEISQGAKDFATMMPASGILSTDVHWNLSFLRLQSRREAQDHTSVAFFDLYDP